MRIECFTGLQTLSTMYRTVSNNAKKCLAVQFTHVTLCQQHATINTLGFLHDEQETHHISCFGKCTRECVQFPDSVTCW